MNIYDDRGLRQAAQEIRNKLTKISQKRVQIEELIRNLKNMGCQDEVLEQFANRFEREGKRDLLDLEKKIKAYADFYEESANRLGKAKTSANDWFSW